MSSNPCIVAVRAKPVLAPLKRPPQTASGSISSAALVLIDIEIGGGIIGHSYVFAFAEQFLNPTAGCIAALASMIVGDPLAPFEVEKKLRARLRLLDTPGLVGLAVAGIDMALWDALAKVQQLPLVRLLGGVPKPVKAYNSCGLWISEPGELADEAEQLLKEGGFGALKIRLGRADFAADVDAVERVKARIGDDVRLMSDFNQCLSTNEALYRCQALDDLALYWLEEPIRHDDFHGCAQIADRIKTPIQLGENLRSAAEMQLAIQAGAANFYMPDVQRIGGVSGWLRVAAVAEASGFELSSHLFPEFSRHLLAVSPTAHYLEYVDWASAVLVEPVAIANGDVLIDEQIGCGIQWNDDAVEKYRMA